tara:strand:- start:2207 stop:2473 length:267 start_codon:yes stop_codon:yes gene_type:complete
MTTSKIQKQVKKAIIKDFVKNNEVFSWTFKEEMVTVTMQTTCGKIGEEMKWDFFFVYEEGNKDCFSKYELAMFPEMVIEPKIKVYQMD